MYRWNNKPDGKQHIRSAIQLTGPNTFTSTSQNPVISNISSVNSGTYLVAAIVNGCSSTGTTVAAIVNPIPAAPVAGSNSPVCVGQTLNLSANSITGATYAWTGPGGYTSSLQNPSISSATNSQTGIYHVNVTVSGCTVHLTPQRYMLTHQLPRQLQVPTRRYRPTEVTLT